VETHRGLVMQTAMCLLRNFAASLTAPQDGWVDPAVADRHRQFRAVLAALSAGQRSPLELYHFEGLDYQEISRRLGMTLSQVKNNIFRGRRKLRQRLSRRDFMPSAT